MAKYKYLIESGMITRKSATVPNAREIAKELLNQYPRESTIYKITDRGNKKFEVWDVDWKKTQATHKTTYKIKRYK